jgi:hypothetical protein
MRKPTKQEEDQLQYLQSTLPYDEKTLEKATKMELDRSPRKKSTLPQFSENSFDPNTPIDKRLPVSLSEFDDQMSAIFGIDTSLAVKLMRNALMALPLSGGRLPEGSKLMADAVNEIIRLVAAREPRDHAEAMKVLQIVTLQNVGMNLLDRAIYSQTSDSPFAASVAEDYERRAMRLLKTAEILEDGIHKRRTGGKQAITVIHQNVTVDGRIEGDDVRIVESS